MINLFSQCAIYVTSTIIVLASVFYAYARYKLSYWSRRGVKSPPTHLLFGNFKDTLTFRKPPGVVLREIYESADPDDPYVGFYIFHKPMLLLRDLDLIKTVMIKDFEVFPNRRFGGDNQSDGLGLVSLLSVDQPRWKQIRTKLTPTLTSQKMKRMIPLMTECNAPLLGYIDNAAVDANGWRELELKNMAARYATDVFSSLIFGVDTNSFDERDAPFWRAVQNIFTGVKRGVIFLVLFLLPQFAGIIEPITSSPAKFFRKVFWDSVNARREIGTPRGDFVDSWLAFKDEQSSSYKFEGDHLLAQPMSFFVAGLEATSTAIAFTLLELAKNPEYEDRLYKEVQDVINRQGLTVDSINEMPFLDSIVTESLRLYPPLPLIDRVPIRDYKIPNSDLVIEKGTPVYVSINGTNRDSRYFSEPLEFQPLRMKDVYDIRGFLAFGIGPRSCIGQRIAFVIVKVAIITIVTNYALAYKSRKDNVFNPITVFTSAADGVHVQLKKRTNK